MMAAGLLQFISVDLAESSTEIHGEGMEIATAISHVTRDSESCGRLFDKGHFDLYACFQGTSN